jgi:uncharacterized membrane protein YkoI
MSRNYVLASVILLGSVMAAQADTPSVSPGRARAAMEAGQILPLETLFRTVERHYVGRIIEAVLRERDGIWIYEFELLPPDGKIYELEMDAKTGAVLNTSGPVREKR